MTGWGEVLEAMQRAPRGVRTLRLVVDQPNHLRPPPAPTAGTRGTARSIVLTMTSVGPAPSTQATLWFDATDGRYRVERAGSTITFDGERRWHELGDGRILVRDRTEQPDHELLLLLIDPSVLLGWYRFDDRAPTEVLGRPATIIRGRRRANASVVAPALDFFLPGPEVSATIDDETGILVAFELRDEGVVTFELQVLSLAVDDVDPDQLFASMPPPGSRVITSEDLRAEHMAELERLRESGVAATGMAPRPALAATTMRVGPPPDDEDAARAGIRHAIEHLTDIDEHDRCPHIQGGANLADCVRRTRRSPYVDDDGASFECTEIAFVRADEAAVRFRVLVPRAPMGGIDTDGRALLVDGRWVVDRATACGLFAMAGVTCPPPPDA
jgi:hypothetical protein